MSLKPTSSTSIVYKVIDLTPAGSMSNYASHINNAGAVAGNTQTMERGIVATSWKLAADGSLITDYIGQPGSYAMAVNNNGVFAGQRYPGGADTHNYKATIWDHGQTITLGALDNNQGYSTVYAINDNNQAVGYSTLSNKNIIHAVSWTNGNITDLGSFGGNNSYAKSINNAGTIVGWAEDKSNVEHAAIWDHGKTLDLGAGRAMSINEAGAVSGFRYDSKGHGDAVVWTSTGVQTLKTAQTKTFGAVANAINNHNQVVGSEADSNSLSGIHAVYWSSLDAKAIDLNSFLSPKDLSAGWNLIEAKSINDQGQIVAMGFNTNTFEQHAFLLSPDLGKTNAVDVIGVQAHHNELVMI